MTFLRREKKSLAPVGNRRKLLIAAQLMTSRLISPGNSWSLHSSQRLHRPTSHTNCSPTANTTTNNIEQVPTGAFSALLTVSGFNKCTLFCCTSPPLTMYKMLTTQIISSCLSAQLSAACLSNSTASGTVARAIPATATNGLVTFVMPLTWNCSTQFVSIPGYIMPSFESNKNISDTLFHYSAVIWGSLTTTSKRLDYENSGLLRCDAASMGKWFKVQDMQKEILHWHLNPWRWTHRVPTKYEEPFTQQHSVTPQKTSALNYATAKTPTSRFNCDNNKK